jgi:hypothetical protein
MFVTLNYLVIGKPAPRSALKIGQSKTDTVQTLIITDLEQKKRFAKVMEL